MTHFEFRCMNQLLRFRWMFFVDQTRLRYLSIIHCVAHVFNRMISFLQSLMIEVKCSSSDLLYVFDQLGLREVWLTISRCIEQLFLFLLSRRRRYFLCLNNNVILFGSLAETRDRLLVNCIIDYWCCVFEKVDHRALLFV